MGGGDFLLSLSLKTRIKVTFIKGYLLSKTLTKKKESQKKEKEIRSINHHSRRHLATDIRRQLGGLFFFTARLIPVDMRFQPLVEVGHAHATVDEGDHDEHDGNDGEESQGFLSWLVFLPVERLVNPDELEKEVCQGSKVQKLELC